jgi:hypothetical protein
LASSHRTKPTPAHTNTPTHTHPHTHPRAPIVQYGGAANAPLTHNFTHSLPFIPPFFWFPFDRDPTSFSLSCRVRPGPSSLIHTHSLSLIIISIANLSCSLAIPSVVRPHTAAHRTRTHASCLPHLSTPVPPTLSSILSLSLYRLPIQQPLSLSLLFCVRARPLSLSLSTLSPSGEWSFASRRSTSQTFFSSLLPLLHQFLAFVSPANLSDDCSSNRPARVNHFCPSTIGKNLHQTASTRSTYTYPVDRHASSDRRTLEDPIDRLALTRRSSSTKGRLITSPIS